MTDPTPVTDYLATLPEADRAMYLAKRRGA